MTSRAAAAFRSSFGIAAAGALIVAGVRADPPAEALRPVPSIRADGAGGDPTVAEARAQARLLQSTYDASLRAIHRKYFDADEKEAIPARVLEDVFLEVDAGTGRTSRWISVNTPAMNVEHEPRDEFEKQAAEALSSGVGEFEEVRNGVYRRAGEVHLVASCLKCHLSSLTRQVQKDRVAALVISMPIRDE